jgi:2-methylaconitate cis-trans-isomerase PrpF
MAERLGAKVTPPVPPVEAVAPIPRVAPADSAGFKDALLGEIRKTIAMAYNTVVVQAQQIQVSGDRVTLTFSASQKLLPAFEKYRAPIEALAMKLAGRKMTLVYDASGVERTIEGKPRPAAPGEAERKSALKERALADEGVQAMLEVFPAEIRDVEEM